MKLIIDRSKWYRGLTTGSALIRTEDGKMCCLGFLGIAFEGDRTEILGQTMPNKSQTFWPLWLFEPLPIDDGGYSKTTSYITISQNLANINDNPHTNDNLKELEISGKMKKYGDIDVEFVGE